MSDIFPATQEDFGDLILDAKREVGIRQNLVQVALSRRPADRSVRVGRLFNAHTGTWAEDQEIVVYGRRIAWLGPAGTYKGEVKERVHYPELSAVPGFGEVHKHIESSHLTPEFEAELVLPRGNTWTCEASHEFSNVNGARNLEFWQAARKLGLPLKIFVQPGSAVPPSAWERTGGHYDYKEQADFLSRDLTVVSLDEVMDWPAVTNPTNPAYSRVWGMIRATFEKRGVVEGHGAGIFGADNCSAFAAAGLSSDHEPWTDEEVWDKLNRGIFIAIKPLNFPAILPGLIGRGLKDWSNLAFTTDDRSASMTLRVGASDYNARYAVELGVPVETAIQCVTINPARHMRIDAWVGSITPGRYADIVLLDDVGTLSIAKVYSDGVLVAEDGHYVGPQTRIDWPQWATETMNVGRTLTAEDFAILAGENRKTMQAALLKPFQWNQDYLTEELAVENGKVLRDASRKITKFAVVDRYSGNGAAAKMFWHGCGPADPDTALACSVAHDSHNVWVVGSSDEAMATAVNRLQKIGGGWALVHRGELVADVRYEVGGLMSSRPAEELDADMQRLYRAAAAVDWMYEPSAYIGWQPGFPEVLAFATLTCAPWSWVLVAPHPDAPSGFVNVQTGESRPVVW